MSDPLNPARGNLLRIFPQEKCRCIFKRPTLQVAPKTKIRDRIRLIEELQSVGPFFCLLSLSGILVNRLHVTLIERRPGQFGQFVLVFLNGLESRVCRL